MRTLAQRLTGKRLQGISTAEPGLSLVVQFTDGTALAVYTSVTASLRSAADTSRVESVTVRETEVELRLAGEGYVKVSTDRDRYSVVEAYVFVDGDGTILVENGN